MATFTSESATMIRTLRATPATMMILAAAAVTACAGGPSVLRGQAIDRVLAPQVTPPFQAEVLVLGTSHLSEYRDQLRPEHLQRLLALLVAWAPTHVAVESLTADEIALLAELEAHDSAAAQVLDMFGRGTLTAGRTMQRVLAVDRVAAGRSARAMAAQGALTDDDRVELTGLLLAAYEYNSATLQWSLLPEDVRQRDGPLPPELRDALNRRLGSANEIVTLAMPIARRLGLPLLHSMDSQYDGMRTLSAPREELYALLTHPDRARLQDGEARERADRVRRDAFAAGDLLPMYLHANSDEHHAGDVTQWNWLFQPEHAAGLGRLRYAMWELRNMRQAMHIIDVAATGGAQRLLVIVGSSHKPYLDRLLATQLSVRLVQLEDLVATAR
jgi:hypothetical protein